MKKVIWLFLIFGLNFIFVDIINANTSCYYTNYDSNNYEVEYGDDGNILRVYINHELVDKDIFQLDDYLNFVYSYGECNKILYLSEIGETLFVANASMKISGYADSEELIYLMTPSEYRNNKSDKVSCGNITKIPSKIPKLTSDFVTIIQVLVPVILVIAGCLDLVKSISSQKEDEIKKGQKILIKRIVTAIIIFFVIVLVKFVISIISNTSTANIIECIDCFVSNNCSSGS